MINCVPPTREHLTRICSRLIRCLLSDVHQKTLLAKTYNTFIYLPKRRATQKHFDGLQ